MEQGDYREYDVSNITANKVNTMFEKLQVKRGVMTVVKDINEQKKPKFAPTERHNMIDYLKDGLLGKVDARSRAGTTINSRSPYGSAKRMGTSPQRSGTVRNKNADRSPIVETQESVVAFFDAPKQVTVTTKPPLSPTKAVKAPYRKRTGT
jgi:hypothetical protein